MGNTSYQTVERSKRDVFQLSHLGPGVFQYVFQCQFVQH